MYFILYKDDLNLDDLPLRMRTMQDDINTTLDKDFIQKNNYRPIKVGLKNIQASGSGQFSVENFKKMISYIGKRTNNSIMIVDLRQESHCFINELPLTIVTNFESCFQKKKRIELTSENRIHLLPENWCSRADFQNIGYSVPQIEREEEKTIETLNQEGKVRLFIANGSFSLEKIDMESPIEYIVENKQLEKNLVQNVGLEYVRLPIANHFYPDPATMDYFVQFYQKNKNKWIHFHCNAGKGRTTLFLTFLDMMHNARSIGLQSILARQYLLGPGGENLLLKEDAIDWIGQLRKTQFEFINHFYWYCKTNSDNFDTPYSYWLAKKENNL